MELGKVTSKGQITIPKSIREHYNLTEGSRVFFIEDGDRVYMINAELFDLLQNRKKDDGE